MTTATHARPRLRDEVRLGPALKKGTGAVHYLKDDRTGWYFQVGEREFFLISRLDGASTLEEIGAQYAEKFDRRLGPQHWRQVMGLLGTRGLLVGSAGEQELDRLAEQAAQRNRKRPSLLGARLPIVDPDRAFGRWAPRLRPLFSPWFVLPALAGILALAVVVAARPGTLFADAKAAWHHPALLIGAIAVVWFSIGLHEAAHGLACKHFGGRAPEIGVLWRFPFIAPYCKADDLMLFARRSHRVYTAFAGIFVNLVVVLPFGALWLFATHGSTAQTFGAEVVFFGGINGIVNLIPFLQLDGYHMVNHALGAADLRTDSIRFAHTALTGLWRRDLSAARAYPAGRRWLFGAYAVGSVVYAAGLVARVVVLLVIAPPIATYIVLGVLGTGVVLGVVDRRVAARRETGAATPF